MPRCTQGTVDIFINASLVTVVDPTGFATGQQIRFKNAREIGEDLIATIASISGNEITLNGSAGVSVTDEFCLISSSGKWYGPSRNCGCDCINTNCCDNNTIALKYCVINIVSNQLVRGSAYCSADDVLVQLTRWTWTIIDDYNYCHFFTLDSQTCLPTDVVEFLGSHTMVVEQTIVTGASGPNPVISTSESTFSVLEYLQFISGKYMSPKVVSLLSGSGQIRDPFSGCGSINAMPAFFPLGDPFPPNAPLIDPCRSFTYYPLGVGTAFSPSSFEPIRE